MNEEDIKRIREQADSGESIVEKVKQWEAELRVMMDNYLKFGRGEHHVHTYMDRGVIDGISHDKSPVGLPKKFIVSFDDMIELMRKIKNAEG